jgi:hypothetical protein
MALNPRRRADPTTPQSASRSSRNPSTAVPVGIWLCAPATGEHHDIPRLPDGITRRLITRIVEEFSPPDGTIVVTGSDSDAECVAALAASHTDRHVTAIPVTDGDRNGSAVDDGSPTATPSPVDPAAGTADLVVALALPTPPSDTTHSVYSRWARWLRPGGTLVVITRNPAGAGRFANHTGTVISRAEAAGLTYLQHVIAVLAHVEGDRLLINGPRHNASVPRRPRETVHLPSHSDVLIFLPHA